METQRLPSRQRHSPDLCGTAGFRATSVSGNLGGLRPDQGTALTSCQREVGMKHIKTPQYPPRTISTTSTPLPSRRDHLHQNYCRNSTSLNTKTDCKDLTFQSVDDARNNKAAVGRPRGGSAARSYQRCSSAGHRSAGCCRCYLPW